MKQTGKKISIDRPSSESEMNITCGIQDRLAVTLGLDMPRVMTENLGATLESARPVSRGGLGESGRHVSSCDI